MTSIDRRSFLKGAGAAGLTTLSGALPPALAADDSRAARARAEGKMVYYANMTAAEPIMKAFHDATGVDGQYTRLPGPKFVPTVLTEAGAGKLLADVVQAPRDKMGVLKENGILAPYKSPSAAGYPDWALAEEAVTYFGIEYMSYLFNTQHVKRSDAPQTYEDLADPKWRNKLVMPNPSTSGVPWLIGLKEQVFKSEERWLAYVKALAANKPMFVASLGPTPAPVESGEKLIAISMPKYIITKAPAPLDWGPRGGEPLLGMPRAIAIAAKAPHPDAARVFFDYWLSKEAMSLLAKSVGEYVLAPGVYPAIDGIDKVEVLPLRVLSDEETKKWTRELKKIFGV